MSAQIDRRDVFLASPSGLESEREAVRDIVRRFNEAYSSTNNVFLSTRGWEDLPPGIGRAQEQVNAVLDGCDFLLVLMADHWGSDPGGGAFTSGTEEEVSRAFDLLADEAANMRDVAILFRSVSPDRLADAGPQLNKVLEFKRKLEASKQVFYGTFDDADSLQSKVEVTLRKWAGPLNPRRPVLVDLDSPTPPVASTSDLVEDAERLSREGLHVSAESRFAEASKTGDPEALLAFARYMRRRGRLQDARELNARVIATVGASPTSKTVQYLVAAVANNGVIARKQGDLTSSLQLLREAVDLARNAKEPRPAALAYSLDNLGHTFSQLNRYEQARNSFAEAAAIRATDGSDSDRATSVLNLGWLELRQGSPGAGLQRFEEAERCARANEEHLSLAASLTGKARCLIRLDRGQEALEPLEEALRVNEQIASSDGIGITSGLLARLCASLGDLDGARAALGRLLESSAQSGNPIGALTAEWAQALIYRLRGDEVAASVAFERALDLAQKSGNSSLARSIERSFRSGQI